MTITRNKTSNRFCGPAALAALTGIHVDDAARTLRVVSGKQAIKGVADRHMLAAFERLGYKAERVTVDSLMDRRLGRRPTLTQALAGALKGRQSTQRYLVLITGHYVTIQGRKLVDNKHPEGIALTACPYRRRRVRAIWAIDAAAPVPPPAAPMTFRAFSAALDKLNLDTDTENVDAPRGWCFQSGLHGLAITGTYEEALADVASEMPLIRCGGNCDCCYE